MNIDFEKLLKLLLPTFMRVGLAALIKAVAGQFTSLYADFQLWQIDIRLQASMTAQLMYLEMILNYRLLGSFLRTIYITDGDGIVVDFIVNVPAAVTVDNYRLIALIEKYKIAGKRYSIGQSALTYDVEWSDHVCELLLESYEAAWTDNVCALNLVSDSFYLYMGTLPTSTIPAYSSTRAYYTNPGGAGMNNTLYNDSALQSPVVGYANKYIGVSRDGTGTQYWVQIDANGLIINTGNY